MPRRIASSLVIAAFASACADNEGHVDVRLVWKDAPPPAVARTPFLFLSIADAGGQPFRTEGPIELVSGAEIDLLPLPSEVPYVLAATVHASPWRNSPIEAS